MSVLDRMRLRTKLTLLLGLSALAVVASIGLAASQLQQRMLSDRVDKLRAATQMVLGLARTEEQQVTAGRMTRQGAIAQVAAAMHVMHFDNGDGYVSFTLRNGIVLVHGGDARLDGKPSPGRNAAGRSVGELAWAALQSGPDGVITYSAPKPGHTQPLAKVAYVARFEPWQAAAVASAYVDDLGAALHRALLRLAVTGGVVLLTTLAVAWLINRDIVGSLTGLQAVMAKLAEGDLAADVRGAGRRDEIGGMARAVLVFKRHMENAARLAAEKEQEQHRANLEKQSALMQMADRIETETSQALEEIGRRTVALAHTASGMNDAANRTGNLAQDAAVAAGQALTTAETVAGAARQLASSIREIGGQVTQSTRAVDEAVAASEETRGTIQALNEQVGQIGSVADIIREIAARTNLLALNATIEAARAGDAGKGFAVVASEVKQLANQTAHSTEEITKRIGEVRTATGASVAAVARIEQTIGTINTIAASIAAAMEQQGAATAEIARNVAETASAANAMTARTQDVRAEAISTGQHAADVQRDASATADAVGALRQSVVRVVRTSTAEVDRRAAGRRAVDLPCRIVLAGGAAHAGRVVDISSGGARVSGVPALGIGARGSLDIPALGSPLSFTVRGAGDGNLHVAFEADAAATARLEATIATQWHRAAA